MTTETTGTPPAELLEEESRGDRFQANISVQIRVRDNSGRQTIHAVTVEDMRMLDRLGRYEATARQMTGRLSVALKNHHLQQWGSTAPVAVEMEVFIVVDQGKANRGTLSASDTIEETTAGEITDDAFDLLQSCLTFLKP